MMLSKKNKKKEKRLNLRWKQRRKTKAAWSTTRLRVDNESNDDNVVKIASQMTDNMRQKLIMKKWRFSCMKNDGVEVKMVRRSFCDSAAGILCGFLSPCAVVKLAVLLFKNINYIQLPNMWKYTKLLEHRQGERVRTHAKKKGWLLSPHWWYNYSRVIINIVITFALALHPRYCRLLFMNLVLNWLLLILNKFKLRLYAAWILIDSHHVNVWLDGVVKAIMEIW